MSAPTALGVALLPGEPALEEAKHGDESQAPLYHREVDPDGRFEPEFTR
jgi:hypothetical protein